MNSLTCPPIVDLAVEQILDAFRHAGSVLPEAAMQAALDRWDEILPAAVELFNRRENDVDADYDPRFFLVHLAGEMCDPRTHVPICRMIIESRRLEAIISGTITVGLRGILINTFDGDPASLQAVVNAEYADEFARAEALSALAYLFAEGRLADFDMCAYLASLAEELQPRSDNFVWAGWADTVAQLGFRELLPAMEQVFSEGLIDEFCFDLDEIVELLEFSEAHGAKAALTENRIQPYGSAIKTLSTWWCFSPKYNEYKHWCEQVLKPPAFSPLDKNDLPRPPATNHFRDIGRNDPCPCGSGKKFKKCCIGAAS